MPTTLRRVQVTVTPGLEKALAAADQVWPDRAQSELLARLAELGASTLDARKERARAARGRALRETAGSLDASYPKGYLDDLRGDWPA